MKKIAIFASGSGTNAEAIIRHFNGGSSAEDRAAGRSDGAGVGTVELLLSNNKDAYALVRAQQAGVSTHCFTAAELRNNPQAVLDVLREHDIDFIVLAGFMLLVPKLLVDNFQGRIVNIHPALLPLHGGRGMYGHHVHRAVIADGDAESGITIHFVNEKYDQGDVIFQARCAVTDDDRADASGDSLAEKIHVLEHQHYPVIIERLVREL